MIEYAELWKKFDGTEVVDDETMFAGLTMRSKEAAEEGDVDRTRAWHRVIRAVALLLGTDSRLAEQIDYWERAEAREAAETVKRSEDERDDE